MALGEKRPLLSMKLLLILLITSTSVFAHSQQGAKSVEDPRQIIWNTAVQAIIDFDEDKIFELTHFPLEGDWHTLDNPTMDELKKLYKQNLDYFFSMEMRDV